MDKTLKFVVCGLGHIGKRHAAIIDGYNGTELVAIVDIDQEAFASSQYQNTIPHFEDLQAFFNSDVDANIVVVATPTGLHTQHTMQALKAGYHVIVEKPMGISKIECEAVVSTALNANKQVFVVKQNRYSPPSKWLKEIVQTGKLGSIYQVQINCYWNRDDRYYKPGGWKGTVKLDGGVLFTQFSHFIDIMFWVFGDIKNIKTNLNNFNHQDNTEFADSGNSIFEFVQGGNGCINFSTSVWNKNMESSITVIGEKGSLKIGGQYMNEVEYCHIENYEMPILPPTNPPNDYGPFKGSAANHHYVIENVVNTLQGNDTITANALEGLKVVDIIERIYDAAN